MPAALGLSLSELITLIGAGATVGTGIYTARSAGEQQQAALNAQEQMQQQAQQQQQQQALAQRRQQMAREGPSLQSQVGGSFTAPQFQATEASLTGNPSAYMPIGGGGAGSEGSLTPAMENLFPSGGVPSLTEPWPQNV